MLTRRTMLSLAPWAALRAQLKRPNILLILADDLGYGDISLHGAPDVRTPNIDALAASGMTFENFYANCPVCSPTRTALMSGRYPDTVGVPGVIRKRPETSWGSLAPEVTLLPRILRASGYGTTLVGKWHLGEEAVNLPNARGFDLFRGMHGGMMMDYHTYQGHQDTKPDLWRNSTPAKATGHATDVFTGWAVEAIRSWRGADQPAFLYMAFNAPHNPVQPPADWLRKAIDRGIPEKRAKLVALIEHMDHGIGRLMAALKESGQLDNTVVIFTSDNGGDCPEAARNAPWRGCKGEVYEGGIRVPGIVSWPGHVAAGARTGQIALSMDLAATIAEIAGVRFADPVDGVSLLPILTGRSSTLPARDLFWTRREGGQPYAGMTIHAMRRGDWKLVYNSPFQPFELYNLKEDPYEKNDLAKANRARLTELTAALMLHLQRAARTPWQR